MGKVFLFPCFYVYQPVNNRTAALHQVKKLGAVFAPPPVFKGAHTAPPPLGKLLGGQRLDAIKSVDGYGGQNKSSPSIGVSTTACKPRGRLVSFTLAGGSS